jgi:FtsZ-binding cell division protein ZapB
MRVKIAEMQLIIDNLKDQNDRLTNETHDLRYQLSD